MSEAFIVSHEYVEEARGLCNEAGVLLGSLNRNSARLEILCSLLWIIVPNRDPAGSLTAPGLIGNKRAELKLMILPTSATFSSRNKT